MDLKILKLAAVGCLAFSLVGCAAKKKEVKKEEPKQEEQKPPEQAEEPSLRNKDYKEMPEVATVYFELDQATLRPEARAVLQKNFEALKGHADWEALVEGHSDERGTTEYNLGLGQRRAAAVRQYYMTLGLDGARIATISYGKENPACTEHTEGCWAKNRRGVTKVRGTEGK